MHVAKKYYNDAYKIAKMTKNDRVYEGFWLGWEGVIDTEQCWYYKSKIKIQEAIEIAKQIGMKKYKAQWMVQLGCLSYFKG